MSTTNPNLLPLSRGWAADAAPLGIAALAPDGTILYANPALEALLESGRGELVGRSASEFHPIPELALSLARDRRFGNAVRGLELGLLSIGGREVSVRITARILEDGPGGAAVVATVEDISTMRVRESSENQARTMSAVGRLAGGMAHHFNNLLASILGQVDLLEGALEYNAEARNGIASIAQAARRAREIADLLLVVSGKEVGSREQVELEGWIHRMAGRLRSDLPDDVELVVRAGAGPHPVLMDPERLARVIGGLVANAEEALPGGGTITLSLDRWLPESTGDAHLFSPHPGSGAYACITVEDDGMGMNEETLSRAMEPFFSTKRDREGAGLGLATIYGIVAQSAGHVAIESEPVIGTRVRVLLPLGSGPGLGPAAASLLVGEWAERVQSSAPGSAPSAGSIAEGPARGILVVDDEDSIREVMEKILLRARFKVFLARDGREAQRVFQTEREKIGMVVTDVMMPRMNGVEFLEWLAHESPDTATLMVSGFAGSPLVQQWVDRDPSAFLAKPFEAPEFLERVEERWRLARSRARG